MLLKLAIEAFRKHLLSMDRSPETIRGYVIQLSIFAAFLERLHNGLVYLDDVTAQNLEDYLCELKNQGQAPASRSRAAYILRSFFTFANQRGLVAVNIAAGLEPVKVPEKEREHLSEDEVNTLVEAIGNDLIRTVVLTLYLTGLRISECLKLTLKNVDLDNRIIHVIAGKGKKNRLIPISDRLHAVLSNYLANVRPDVASDCFFATAQSGRLSAVYVNRTLVQTTTSLGWEKTVTCHILRHSFASSLLRNDVNIVKVQKLLGHASIKTTGIYTHTNLEELTTAVNTL